MSARHLGRDLLQRFLSTLVSKYQGSYEAPWKISFMAPARRLGRPSTAPYKRLGSQ
ncbi:hypothetical protein PanWU01x14_226990, partial [Parasponia andersonii]